MQTEIERKWLVKELPDLSKYKAIEYERHFLSISPNREERIQRVGDKYEYEVKETNNVYKSVKSKKIISVADFERYKTKSIKSITRSSYTIQKSPEISVKIYHGIYKGLIRVEAEFSSESEAKIFVPPDWFGTEITNTILGRDSKLVMISQDDFIKELNRCI